MNKIFCIEPGRGSHVVIYFLGFKIRFLKPYLRKLKSEYVLYEKPEDVPVATGMLRDFQMANLALLRYLDKFCKENNLSYWLDFGTLLGAVRHKGFIPWDDDIDLGMMRSDYERLIELLKEDENLVLQYGSNGRHKCFVKIRHKVFERIFIDIFPYDMYFSKTNSKEKAKLHNLIKKVSDGLKHSLIKENNPEKLYKKLKKITNKKILKNKIVKEEDKPSLFWGIDFPHGWKNRVYDWEDIFPLTEVRYENFSFPAPANVHNVLSNIYGEYMKLPKDAYPRHMHINGLNDLEKEKLYKLIEISKNL